MVNNLLLCLKPEKSIGLNSFMLQSALHESNSRGSSGCLDPGSVFGSSSLCVLLFWLLVSRVFSGSGLFLWSLQIRLGQGWLYYASQVSQTIHCILHCILAPMYVWMYMILMIWLNKLN